MNEDELVSRLLANVHKSDRNSAIDVGTTLVGLLVFAYTMNPEPFDRLAEAIRTKINAIFHRISVWEAISAIRSLPETDK